MQYHFCCQRYYEAKSFPTCNLPRYFYFSGQYCCIINIMWKVFKWRVIIFLIIFIDRTEFF